MRVSGLMDALRDRLIKQAETGYVIVMYTPRKWIVDNKGDHHPVLPFDIIGPYEDPNLHLLPIVNLLDEHGVQSYNVQALFGVLDEKADVTDHNDWCESGLPHRTFKEDEPDC